MLQTTPEERVARGAALLDEREPGWAERVNLEWLNMQYSHACVLGQLAPFGSTFFSRFGFTSWPDATEYGFFYPTDDPDYHRVFVERYAELTELWKRAIRERLAERELVPA